MQLDIVSNLNIKNNQKISILPKQNNNINFKGLFSDISDSYIRRSQEKIHENAAFKEAIDSSISARRMMSYALNNFESNSNGFLDEYNSFKMLAQHSNPYFSNPQPYYTRKPCIKNIFHKNYTIRVIFCYNKNINVWRKCVC